MALGDKAILTCALTGILTDPERFGVPVTPMQMASHAKEAFDAGASIMHVHVRDQRPGMGAWPSWSPEDAMAVVQAIRESCPGVIINLSTGIVGPDISGPVACLERVKPEMAALNAGSLNYLKVKSDGTWAWPPMVFDNPVEKVEQFARVMYANGILPECECFDAGIVRSVELYRRAGILRPPIDVSIIMGVESGMPAKPAWLPLLIEELPQGASWQVIAIGRQNVWELHKKAAELGGNLRTGLEDTLYLPDGTTTRSNGKLIEALAEVAKEAGRGIATPSEARAAFGMPSAT